MIKVTQNAFFLTICLAFGCIGSICFLECAKASQTQLEAFEYMTAKDYPKAIKAYTAALAEKPNNSWQIQVNIANCYSGLGEHKQALNYLLDSIYSGGLHPTQCMNISAIYQKLGDNKKALSWLQAACTLDPIGAGDPTIQNTMRKLQDSQNCPTGSPATADYVESLIFARKWHAKALPIKVFVRKNIEIPEFYDEFSDIVQNALNQWCKASLGRLSYYLVSNKEAANVVCDYTDHRELLDAHYDGDIEGSTQTRVQMGNNSVDWANIVVLVKDSPDQSTYRSRIFLTQTTLHEFGHVLGMHGHSPNSKDVMFPFATLHSTGKLSERDKQTIKKIYQP